MENTKKKKINEMMYSSKVCISIICYIGNYKNILYDIDKFSKVFDNVRFHYIFLVGTKYFAVIALKAGRHRMAILAMITLGISAICVSP